MKSDLPYYVALAATPGIGPVHFKLLIKHFKTAENIWREKEEVLEKVLTPAIFRQFIAFRKSFDVDSYYKKIAAKNVKVITIDDKSYPSILKEISDPPPVLYIKGNLDLGVENRCIAVVGSRKITSYGRQVTEILVGDLVAAGFTIISGLARGVDSLAHKATLENKGKTIAVLGSGVCNIYPPENVSLAENIINNDGAVISEYPLEMLATPGNFPSRNRIISGLSLGVLVTEAGEDSGSLITAGLAGEQGREVFAVPGPIYSGLAKGPAQLIKQGAKLVMNVGDILEELNIDLRSKMLDLREIKGDTEEEQTILDLLRNGPTHIDEIARASKLPASKIGSILSLMEIKGKVKNLGSGSYSLPN
ncbi:MAG: DNA protecting protein DprA [Candidatus Woykebacteria bacterium RBG_13_40_15]|uniref:DNA protecting protein DprA n=1 Tax=Candidatus Woykebacteria bacterium RBG_13_40_15 TaxID=1802593 RepID=A0A1G1W676_9BACT|nr:MAG: DNA protecting protein DprA [Candidatus Woykebacteria bacterium RBG_13_40_15]